jgi:hypothetical protein
MMVATQHRNVARTRRTAVVVGDRVVGIAPAGRTATAGKAAPAIAGLDETPHTRRHPITVVTMVTTRPSAKPTTRLNAKPTIRPNAKPTTRPGATVTTRPNAKPTTPLSAKATTWPSAMDVLSRMVWLWDAPAGFQIGQ